MTQEEKAKRYDNLLVKLQEAKVDNDVCDERYCCVIDDIVPELKESEDERIRKWLIDDVKDTISTGNMPKEYEHMAKTAIAWLEKQGDNKPSQTTDLRTWKYIVDAVLTEREGIGQYIDSPWTTEVAKKLQKRFGNIEQDEEYKIGKWFTGLIPCWINAPSTLQPEHSNHGKNVVAVHLKGGGYRCCCVDDKKPITFSVAENTPFVEGWHNRESSAWKPSEEQMEALESATENCAYSEYQDCLRELIGQLKKLRGE